MSTINEIAKIAGVSVATVSRAFNDSSRISSSTKKKILNIAHDLNYSPKQYKKRKAHKYNYSTVGVVISCRNYPWCNLIMGGISSVLETKNITPVYTDTNEAPYREIICIDKLKNFVSGMLVVSSTELDDYSTNFLVDINKSIPVVTLVRNINLDYIDSVGIDCFHHTCTAINHLVDNGHQHIAIINGPMIIKPSLDRFAAYVEVLRKRNIPVRNEYIYYGGFDENNAFDLTIDMLDSHPRITAIFSSNTVITRGCLKAFDHRNIKIPSDIAFISYGDDYSFSLKNMNITAISDPNFEIGQKAATLLLNRMQDKMRLNKDIKRIIVKPEIYWRGSEMFPKNRKANNK